MKIKLESCPTIPGSARGPRAAVGGPPTAPSIAPTTGSRSHQRPQVVWHSALRRAAAKGTPAACAPQRVRFVGHALRLVVVLSLLASLLPAFGQQEKPLRVFLRAGVKTHGPGQHDHPRFLGDWTKLLTERGVKVDGAMEFPTAPQLEDTDVLVIYAADGMKVVGDQRSNFEKFLKRGGGLVVIHDGVVSADEHGWAKKVQGGAWRWDGEKRTKWL